MVRVRKASVTIRQAKSEEDWLCVRGLCCRTGNNGDAIARERWPFFSDLWVGPYQKLRPAYTYVADVGGVVTGYLTGCPDTAAFEKEKWRHVTLPMLARVALRRYEWNADTRRFVRRALKREPGPELSFSPEHRELLQREYPAHLHINVDAACRGLGVGHELVARFLEDLRKAKVRGVHVFCGADPVRFYKSVGFEELDTVDFKPAPQAKGVAAIAAVRVYSMACRL